MIYIYRRRFFTIYEPIGVIKSIIDNNNINSNDNEDKKLYNILEKYYEKINNDFPSLHIKLKIIDKNDLSKYKLDNDMITSYKFETIQSYIAKAIILYERSKKGDIIRWESLPYFIKYSFCKD